MRTLAIVGGLLLAACSTTTSAAPHEPQARVAYGDLDLRRADGRAELVRRVDRAAADYCRDHAAAVTPHHRRADPRYCPASLRAQLMWAMPRRVRDAYDQGWSRRPAGRG